jgi:hypothetical protein
VAARRAYLFPRKERPVMKRIIFLAAIVALVFFACPAHSVIA